MQKSKICPKCKIEKPVGEFRSKNYTYKNGSQALVARCKICTKKDAKEYRNRNPAARARMTARSTEWKKRNRFKSALSASRAVAKRRGYLPCTATHYELKKLFTGKCEICGVPELECVKKLHLDHDHNTGKFKGWLCNRCNVGISMLGDSTEILEAAIDYLKNTKKVKK